MDPLVVHPPAVTPQLGDNQPSTGTRELQGDLLNLVPQIDSDRNGQSAVLIRSMVSETCSTCGPFRPPDVMMGLDTRLVMTGDSDAKKSTKPLRPRQETQERMKPI